MLSFSDRLVAEVRRTHTPLVVGIDPHPDRLAEWPGTRVERALAYGQAVVRACVGRVPAVKPQFAFFEQLGPDGMQALATVCGSAREQGLLVIGDAKRGDIGTTAAAYAAATLAPDAPFPCDALTVSPFLGPDTLAPFLRVADLHQRGLFVLLRTSNPDSAMLQAPVADVLARWLTDRGQSRAGAHGLSGVGAVVGATIPGALAEMRARLPHAWMLVPGYGTQGAAAADTQAAFRPDGLGAVVASARAATFPERATDAIGQGEAGWSAWCHEPDVWMAAQIDRLKLEFSGVVSC